MCATRSRKSKLTVNDSLVVRLVEAGTAGGVFPPATVTPAPPPKKKKRVSSVTTTTPPTKPPRSSNKVVALPPEGPYGLRTKIQPGYNWPFPIPEFISGATTPLPAPVAIK
jgi:hypothetical protein